MLRLVLPIVLCANVAFAQQITFKIPDTSAAQACLDAGGAVETLCFGATIDACLERAGDPAVIPTPCWEHEGILWGLVIDQELRRINQDPQMSPEIWEVIEDAQEAWLVSHEMSCRVSIMSNPRTYNLMPACRARAAFDRLIDLRDTRGADWTEY